MVSIVKTKIFKWKERVCGMFGFFYTVIMSLIFYVIVYKTDSYWSWKKERPLWINTLKTLLLLWSLSLGYFGGRYLLELVL